MGIDMNLLKAKLKHKMDLKCQDKEFASLSLPDVHNVINDVFSEVSD